MSQNGTTPTTDENRVPTTISTPLFVPMMPMFIPYGNANTAGQQYYAPAVYPNVSAFPSTANHRHGNYGLGYNPFYAPFYPTPNNILSPATHVTNSAALVVSHPLISPLMPLQQQQHQQLPHSSTGSCLAGNDTERNKNLNIRECQSPVPNVPKKEKQPLQTVDVNETNSKPRIRKNSSSASSLTSHPESYHMPLASSSSAQDIDSDHTHEDFLTFIEQKTKSSTTMPELNPFASEFSFVQNKTLTKDSSSTMNGTEHTTINENQSSYRLLFDNLIEKSLESIEAIKQSSKKPSSKDMSIQCNQITDSIHRSTQTMSSRDNSDLAAEYSSRTIKIMDRLLENFRNVYQNENHNECQKMARTCDELRHLILFLHRIISPSSSDNEQRNKSTSPTDNPFHHMIEDLQNNFTRAHQYPSSSHIAYNNSTRCEGTTRRPMMSNSNSNPSLFSSRQTDPIIRKLCLLCHRPVEESDDGIHKLCRSLSIRPNMSTGT